MNENNPYVYMCVCSREHALWVGKHELVFMLHLVVVVVNSILEMKV